MERAVYIAHAAPADLLHDLIAANTSGDALRTLLPKHLVGLAARHVPFVTQNLANPLVHPHIHHGFLRGQSISHLFGRRKPLINGDIAEAFGFILFHQRTFKTIAARQNRGR